MVSLKKCADCLVPKWLKTERARQIIVVFMLILELDIILFCYETFANVHSFVTRPEYEVLQITDEGGTHSTIVEKGVIKDCGSISQAEDLVDFVNNYVDAFGIVFFVALLFVIFGYLVFDVVVKVSLLFRNLSISGEKKERKLNLTKLSTVLEFALPPLSYPVYTLYCDECITFNSDFPFLYTYGMYVPSFIGFFSCIFLTVMEARHKDWLKNTFKKLGEMAKKKGKEHERERCIGNVGLIFLIGLCVTNGYFLVCAFCLTFLSFSTLQAVFFGLEIFGKITDLLFVVDLPIFDIIAPDKVFDAVNQGNETNSIFGAARDAANLSRDARESFQPNQTNDNNPPNPANSSQHLEIDTTHQNQPPNATAKK